MSKLLLSAILIVLAAGPLPNRVCSCQKARDHDLAHGANETIEYSEKTVKRITGRVTYWNGDEPAKDVVVEIYEIKHADNRLRPHEIILRTQRKAACITSNDGSFCFPELASGRYLLRAGTLSSKAGMNEVFMKVTVDRRWWLRWFKWDKEIKLGLTPGT